MDVVVETNGIKVSLPEKPGNEVFINLPDGISFSVGEEDALALSRTVFSAVRESREKKGEFLSPITDEASCELHNLSGFFCSDICEKKDDNGGCDCEYCPADEFMVWLGTQLD